MMPKTFFFHGKSADKKRFTVSGIFYFPGFESTPELMNAGIAICSDDDQFSKRVGRDKSLGRLKGEAMRGTAFFDLTCKHTIEQTILNSKDGKFLPNWFIDQELAAFLEICDKLCEERSSTIKQMFDLD